MHRRAVALALCLALSGAATAAAERVVRHDGIERRALVERPAAAGPAPAIVLFHGGRGSAAQIRRYSGLDGTPAGFVMIWPEGLGGFWADGRGRPEGGELRPGDDVGFLRALIAALAAEGAVDPARVYFAGISNGGAMTLRMVCEAPDLVAGAAVVAMTFPAGLACPPGPPVPLLWFLGTADPLVPFAGGPVTVRGRDAGRGSVLAADAAFARFSARNRCGPPVDTPLADSDPADGLAVLRRDWTGCAAPLSAFLIAGGGHTWPGARHGPVLDRLLGPTAQDLSASATILAFFAGLAAR
jgi:polyhydroxybutyrate depolymerase